MKSLFNSIVRALGFKTEEEKFNDIVLECRDLATKLNETVDRLKENPKLINVHQELHQARLELQKLKQIVGWYPNISINNLKGFEKDLEEIDQQVSKFRIESHANVQPSNIDFDTQKNGQFNNLMRIINESIDIARKSKSNEISLARLNLAETRLLEARQFALEQHLDVRGFSEVEAEIERLRGAISNGLDKVDSSTKDLNIYQTYYKTEARELLTEAVQLKKEKRFDEACRKLTEAYSAKGSDDLMIEERLRLPMYLLLAGRGDEGWDLLNKIYKDEIGFTRALVLKQMKVFLKKESVKQSTIDRCLPEFEHTIDESMTFARPQVMNQAPDIFKGYKFFATLQLRTPLRILKRHGEYVDGVDQPPLVVKYEWEGVWMPVAKSWRELGYDIDEFQESEAASEFGPILPSKVLPFLIAVRSIVESNESIDTRILKLNNELSKLDWREFTQRLGGVDVVVNRFFPYFTHTIPNIPIDLKNNLVAAGFTAPFHYRQASDDGLLSVGGLGKARLSEIRKYLEKFSGDDNPHRVENFER